MTKFFEFVNHRWFAIIGCLFVVFGMVYSKFTLSVGMIVLSTRAILNPNLPRYFKTIWQNKSLLAVFSLFFLYLLSGIWSDDHAYFWDRMRMKVPFFTMPLAILALEIFDRKFFLRLLYFFFWLVVLTAIWSSVQFFADFKNVVENYGKGQVMYTPVQHIRFSLMVVLAFCLGVDFLEKGFFVFRPSERWWIMAAMVFMLIFLHLLAVRSGLLALYGVLVFYGVRYIFNSKHYLLGAAAIAVFVAGVWLSFQYVPTLKNKIGYTFWSLDLFEKKQELRDLSDSRRLGSMVAGLALFKENPMLGVGLGDIKNETNEFFKINYPDLADLGLMPHNQYLFVLAACGGLGLLWFLVATLAPLFYRSGWRDALLVTFSIIAFSSFLVEHTLETQVGTALYVFPLMLILRLKQE